MANESFQLRKTVTSLLDAGVIASPQDQNETFMELY